ncbi:hypothetical protein V6N13_100958 [Hibiscus sabdariffa]|uniref:Uncharacterized protein n=1 Tax=Hibiscus sabdariffa TaxID=183260 RepID=A0ABR2QJZ3_9ROSI
MAKEKRTQGRRYHPKERSNTSGGLDVEKNTIDNKRRKEIEDKVVNASTMARKATLLEIEVMLEACISEEEWDAEAGFSVGVEQEELIEDMEEPSFVATTYSKIDYKNEKELEEDMEKPALATTMKSNIDYKEDWIKIESSEPHDIEKVSKDNKECGAKTLDSSEERDSSTSKDKSPWKTGIHQSTSEELCPSQLGVDE